jgi:hypothetical protein
MLMALAMGEAPPGTAIARSAVPKAIASYLHSATLFDLVKV